jgi:polar amino acid transport system substrate-binding protein
MRTPSYCLALALLTCSTLHSQATITTNPAITLATLEYPPYCDTTKKDGGALVGIVREALALEDIPVHVVVMPWPRIVSLTHLGRFDGVIGIWQTDAKNMKLKAATPAFNSPIGAYVMPGQTPLPLTTQWLSGKLAGTVTGYHYPSSITKLKMVLDTTRNDETNLRRLQQQRIQLAITEKAVGDALLRSGTLPLQARPVWGGLVLAQEELSVGFAESSMQTYWLNAFNQGLQKLYQSGRYRQIVETHQLQEFAVHPPNGNK